MERAASPRVAGEFKFSRPSPGDQPIRWISKLLTRFATIIKSTEILSGENRSVLSVLCPLQRGPLIEVNEPRVRLFPQHRLDGLIHEADS